MRKEVHDLCPVLDVPMAVWYPEDEETVHWWRTADGRTVDIRAQRGVDQGCPLASPVFGISTARPAERAIQAIRARDAEASIFQYADDTQFHLDPDELPHAYEHVSREWAVAGLSLNGTKTKVWGPRPDTVLPAGWEKHRIPSMKCLGADFVEDGITATPPRHQEALTEIQTAATALESFAARLCQLQDSGLPRQLSQALLRYAAVGGPQHILMCRPIGAEEVQAYDATLRSAWENVLGIPLTGDRTWERAKLPLKAGGMAVGSVEQRASAAFLTSYVRTLPEVLRRTGLPSGDALRHADEGLDAQWRGAEADLLAKGVPPSLIPLSERGARKSGKQKAIVEAVNKGAHARIALGLTQSEQALLRSTTGPGAARGPRRSSCFPRSKTTMWRIPSSELLWRGALGGA